MQAAGTRKRIQFYYQAKNIHSKRHPLPRLTQVFRMTTDSQQVCARTISCDSNASGAHGMYAIGIIASIGDHGSRHCFPYDHDL